ncbi:MAG: hypothetical protein P8L39_14345 [Halioglobus sp.]|nr:hypothetical protein [Halioglobus sp.]
MTAEITIPRKVMEDLLRITPEQMHYGSGIFTLAAATRLDRTTGKNEWVDAQEKLGRKK